MSDLAIIEAGSTFTKGYLVDLDKVRQVSLRGIDFKANYEASGRITDSDVKELVSLIKELKMRASQVHVFGTSVFRLLSLAEVDILRRELRKFGATDFLVVSAKEESDYTSFGATRNLSFDGPISVMVGGGGSTEVSVYRGAVQIAEALSPIGVGTVNKVFPDLTHDIAKTAPSVVTEWIRDRLLPISSHSGLLVLAGGDFPLLYENAGYPLRKNPYSTDSEKAHVLSVAEKRAHDLKYFFEMPLSQFRDLTPDTPRWWDGTRAMCCFVDAVASQVGANELVPTRISMVYGIAARLLSQGSHAE